MEQEIKMNNQQRICAMAALETKHKELIADISALRAEFKTVKDTLAALLDQNAKGQQYIEFLKDRVAQRGGKK